MLEDTRSGVDAAKASGAYCIGIKNINAEPQDLSSADLILHSLSEVEIDVISSFQKN